MSERLLSQNQDSNLNTAGLSQIVLILGYHIPVLHHPHLAFYPERMFAWLVTSPIYTLHLMLWMLGYIAHLFATQLPFHLESLAPSPPSDGLIISSAKVELIGVHSLPHPDLQPFSSSQLHHCQYPGSIRTASYMHPTHPKNTLMVQWGRIAKVSYFLLHHAHANSLDFCPLIEIKMILLST